MRGHSGFESLLWLGCNHEEQHQELILTDLKYLFSRNPLKPAYGARWPLTTIEARRPGWLRFDGGLVETYAKETLRIINDGNGKLPARPAMSEADIVGVLRAAL